MPSSPSNSLRLEEQFTGENVNLWGVLLNRVISMLDAGIAGMATIPLTGNYTLTSNNFVADEARNAILKFTGTLAVNVAVTIPSVSKIYIAWNATNRVVTITTGSGATVPIDPGDVLICFCDAMGVYTITFGGLDLKSFIAASVLAATGSLPAAAGNNGKYLYCNGSTWLPRQPSTSDLSDYPVFVGLGVAMAIAL